MKQLLALTLALLAAPVMPQSFERTAGIIGILPLPEVFGFESCARFEPRDIPIFRWPTTGRPFGKIYVAKHWTYPREGGCEGLIVQVGTTDSVTNSGELPTMEFAYEQPGAIVLRQTNSWFEIALSKGTGWVRVKDVERFLPVEQLLKDSLLYLRKGAPIPLYTRPGDPAAPRVPGTRTAVDLPAELRAFKRVAGTLWVQVESLSANPCTQEKLPVAPVSGWLPFHDAKGQPSVWFSSRGC
jgi:hypothetical protein